MKHTTQGAKTPNNPNFYWSIRKVKFQKKKKRKKSKSFNKSED